MKLSESFIKMVKRVKGRAVHFRIDRVRLPNGKTATREYLDHPGAVAAVALAGKDKIIMVKQFRHPVRQLTWEIPAGKLAKNENPRACVNRELQEETGYKAKKITRILSYWPTAAFANEVIHIYLAENLVKGKASLDEDEFVMSKAVPLKKLLKQIGSGKIKDSKTMVGILAYELFQRKR